MAVPHKDTEHWNYTCPRWPATATRPARFDYEAVGDEVPGGESASSEEEEEQTEEAHAEFATQAEQQFMSPADRHRIDAALQTITDTVQRWDDLVAAEVTADDNLDRAQRGAIYTSSKGLLLREQALTQASARLDQATSDIMNAGNELRSLPYDRDEYDLLVHHVSDETELQMPGYDDPTDEDIKAERQERIKHNRGLIDVALAEWPRITSAYDVAASELVRLIRGRLPGVASMQEKRDRIKEKLDEARKVILEASEVLRSLGTSRDFWRGLQENVSRVTGVDIHDFTDSEHDDSDEDMEDDGYEGAEQDIDEDAEYGSDEEMDML